MRKSFGGLYRHAEIAAVRNAIRYSIEHGGKCLICTDSLSSVKALINNNNGAFDDFLYYENSRTEIMVMWVPSHIGISGNEHADSGAKRALNHTQITEIPCFPNAMTKPFRSIQQL